MGGAPVCATCEAAAVQEAKKGATVEEGTSTYCKRGAESPLVDFILNFCLVNHAGVTYG